MYFCYVDECGDSGSISADSDPNIMPAFVICGIVLPQTAISELTQEYLYLKRRFFPSISYTHFLDIILHERKGCDIKNDIAKGNRRQRQQAIGFIDGLFRLLETYNAKIIGKLWVKALGEVYQDRVLYSVSIQEITRSFNHLLSGFAGTEQKGIIIIDSRRKSQNVIAAHSIFTQMFQASGNCYPCLKEMPVYGHANNHAPLQIVDIITSAIIFPMLTFSYCSSLLGVNDHIHPNYALIKGRYAPRVKDLQYRYLDSAQRHRGGLVVADALTKRPGKHLFV